MATTDIMLNSAAFLPPERHNEAISLDGLRVIFQTLEESTIRLESKLTEITYRRKPNPIGSNSFYEYQVSYGSIMSEIWIIVDNIYRVSNFLKFIPEIATTDVGKAFNESLLMIKGLRDSLHHIDERITKYFEKEGASILGDIKWRSRVSVNDREESHYLISGVRRLQDPILDFAEVQPKIFLNRVGIYDLRIKYVERLKNKELPFEMNLEMVVHTVNDVIIFINRTYSRFLSDFLGKDFPEVIMPSIASVRIQLPD